VSSLTSLSSRLLLNKLTLSATMSSWQTYFAPLPHTGNMQFRDCLLRKEDLSGVISFWLSLLIDSGFVVQHLVSDSRLLSNVFAVF
jgi:hypothetical protein